MDWSPPPKIWTPPKPAIVRAASLKEIERVAPFAGSFLPGMMAAPFISGARQIGTPITLGGAVGSASSSSVSMTTAAAIPSGALVFVGVFVGKATSISVSSVSDGTNSFVLGRTSTYNIVIGAVVELWYKENASAVGSGATLTANFSSTAIGGSNVPVIVAGYATGIATSSSLDKVNSTDYAPASGTLASGSTGTLTQASELAIGLLGIYNSSVTITEGSGFTELENEVQGGANYWRARLAYQIVNATTALNYQPSSSGSIYGSSIIATFKGA